MSQGPTSVRNRAGLTYRSKTWIGAAFKAARNWHWMLFVIALGSVLCQVRKCTIPISGNFQLSAMCIDYFNVGSIWKTGYQHYETNLSRSNASVARATCDQRSVRRKRKQSLRSNSGCVWCSHFALAGSTQNLAPWRSRSAISQWFESPLDSRQMELCASRLHVHGQLAFNPARS